MSNDNHPTMHGTTILCVRKNNQVVMAGDGQVSLGNTVMKGTAEKVRLIEKHQIITGFAGATADAFTLLERLIAKLDKYPDQLTKSCVELAKDWRTDKYLRKLEAMLIVANTEHTYILTGIGDVLEPEKGVASIGSGGNFALSAAQALLESENSHTAEDIARIAMKVAGDICVFTNHNLTVRTLESKPNSSAKK